MREKMTYEKQSTRIDFILIKIKNFITGIFVKNYIKKLLSYKFIH